MTARPSSATVPRPDLKVPMPGEAVILVIVLAGLAFVLVMIKRGW